MNFVVPIEKTAYFIAKYSPHPVYNYYFTYDGGYGIFKALANIKSAPGVSHADELGYLFYTREFHMNCDGNTTKAPVEDELTLDRMTKLWTNFANTK